MAHQTSKTNSADGTQGADAARGGVMKPGEIINYELKLKRITVEEAGKPYGKMIREPEHVAQCARLLIGDSAQELFIAFFLDVKNRVIGYSEIGRGSIDSCPVDPRTVFRVAIALGASGIVVAHNHPSGDATPSTPDRELTRQVEQVGELLGINLLDHVIVTDTDSFSFRVGGLL